MTQEIRNFLDIDQYDQETLRHILEHAKERKAANKAGEEDQPLKGKQLAMVFEKPSTRTRVSFEVGINQLGGQAIVIDSGTSQIGRGETISDTANVLSRYVDMIMIRTYKHAALKELSEVASVPVINGLTNFSHPCQIMADILTYEERQGKDINHATVAWLGDNNNVLKSWIHAAQRFDFKLQLGMPEELAPPSIPDACNITHFTNAKDAVKNADLIVTDTWESMGDDDSQKIEHLKPFQVNDQLMKEAASDAIFMHCLPAHRGHEVTNSVLDGAQSAVFDEAENRLHAQKAIMLYCMGII